jgi:hypothetical protein
MIPQFPGNVQKGSQDSNSIKLIKSRINEIYGPTLDASSPTFGDSTAAQIKRFQQDRRLLVDGVVGQLTWTRLFEPPQIPSQVTASTLALRALEVARTQLGVREATGHNDGAAVESYLRSVGLGKGYAWCASFVYWCYSQAAKALVVGNPLTQTGGVLDHWARTRGQKVSVPQVGDIFIMDFGEGKGHTGLVKEVRGSMVVTIEGNTNDANSREGDGVYERIRPISSMKGFIRY